MSVCGELGEGWSGGGVLLLGDQWVGWWMGLRGVGWGLSVNICTNKPGVDLAERLYE